MSRELNKVAVAIPPSSTMAINAKANQMIADGENVLKFGIGEPDFNTPENVKAAGKKAIDDNRSKYTPASGIPELKNAICDKLKRENGLEYSPKEVIVSNGGKHSLYNIMLALLNKGDEVIIPIPAWISYKEQVTLAGGKSVFVGTDEAFKISAEKVREAVSEKTKAIIINSPSNPTGATIEESELRAIAELAVEKEFYIISDEVYEKFVYGGRKFISTASLGEEVKDLTLTCNAVSKTYAMTGWRIGYTAGNEKVIKAMGNVQSHSSGNPCSIAQYAALEAFNGQQESVGEMIKQFDERRQYVFKHLNEIDGIKLVEPEGAFYAFPDVRGVFNKSIGNGAALCDYLLEEAKVALVPGDEFGSNNHIRFSYASSMDDIREGIGRIKDAVEKLG
ncbi:MAG: pyridoxal phosphate-dependent aminotransferase [Candidatus Diapherotrites archaeon]